MSSPEPRPPTPVRVRRTSASVVLAAVLVALALVGGACESDQDPGLDPGLDQPAPTSNTLGQCPPGGPDDTTPPAGCLDPDGQVLRPAG